MSTVSAESPVDAVVGSVGRFTIDDQGATLAAQSRVASAELVDEHLGVPLRRFVNFGTGVAELLAVDGIDGH